MRNKKLPFIIILAIIIAAVSSLTACKGPGNNNQGGDNNPPANQDSFADNENYSANTTVTQTKLKTYDGPSILDSSSLVSVSVEGVDLFMYEARVNHTRKFSWTAPTTKAAYTIFDFEGKVEIEAALKGTTVTSAKVTPLAYGITPVITGGKAVFQLSQPGNYTIEFNGDPLTAVHLFTNGIETDAPDPNNLPEDVVYIGPGVYKAIDIPVLNGKTLYVSGGALIYGTALILEKENVAIKGRGIFDCSIYPRAKASDFSIPVSIIDSKNVTVSGITIIDPAGHAVNLYNTENVTINNIKIITSRANGDGISVQSCRNVTVTGGFVRSYDDSLVVKNYDNISTENITFNGAVIWSDFAQSMEVGYECNGEKMENILFKNVTVLHNYHYPAMSIHNADQAAISNVTFQNITVEDAQMAGYNATPDDDWLIELFIKYNASWSSSGSKRGTISKVTFTNINVIEGLDTVKTDLTSYSADNNISQVVFHNVKRYGTIVKNETELKLTKDQHTKDVQIVTTDAAITGAKIKQAYNLNIPQGTAVNKLAVANIDQNSLIIPESIRITGNVPYSGNKNTGATVAVGKGKGTTVSAPITDGFDNADPSYAAAKLLDSDSATSWVDTSGISANDDFVALTFTFPEAKKIGTIRLLGDTAGIYSSKLYISVFSPNTAGTAWTSKKSAQDYEISGASNNYVDVNITAAEFTVIQLRIFARKSSVEHMKIPTLTGIEFYPPSLSFKKAVTASVDHVQEWDASKLTDGDDFSYFESVKTSSAVEIVVNLGDVCTIETIVMQLPPKAVWAVRTQQIAIFTSTDGVTYTELAAKKAYTFDASKGNNNIIDSFAPHNAQYVKFVFYGNSENYGVQMSEIYVYGN